jgi:hypothetical protein
MQAGDIMRRGRTVDVMRDVDMQDLVEAGEHWPLDSPERQIREYTRDGRSRGGKNTFGGCCLAKGQLERRSIGVGSTHNWALRRARHQ